MAIVISGNGIDMGGNPVSNASQIDGAVINENGNSVATEVVVNEQLANATKIGTIITFPVNAAPTGFLECNGALLSRAVYANLFAVIGTTYGVGDGSTTFAIPDLRGEFIRGWDNSRGVDTSRGIGSSQTGATRLLMNGSSTFNNPEGNSATGIIAHKPGIEMIGIEATTWGSYTSRITLRGAMDTTWGGASETRPRNIAMMYCIKY